jgi:AraC-like DNA-binding protein/tetratricopeptide (TPR) repeat protein
LTAFRFIVLEKKLHHLQITTFCLYCLVFAIQVQSYPVSAGNDKSYHDTLVELAMGQSRYRDACNRLLRFIAANQGAPADRKIYWYNRMSLAQMRMRNVDSAMIWAEKSLHLVENCKDSVLIADSWRIAAYAYNNAGKLDSALYFTQLVFGFAERKNDNWQMRNALVSMATIMAQNNKYADALMFHRRASELTWRISDSANFPSNYYNLGLTHLNLNQSDSCLYYLNKAMVLAKGAGRTDLLVYIYGTMADCYLKTGNVAERKKYLLLANQEAEKMGNKQFLAMGYSNLMQGALLTGDDREAVEYGRKALELLKEQPYPVLKSKVDSMMWQGFRKLGNTGKALECLESYLAGRKKLASENLQEKLDQVMVELKVNEKDLTITRQKLELVSKQRTIEILILAGVIIFLLAAGQFLYLYNTRKFRRGLFLKEKELQQYSREMEVYLQEKTALLQFDQQEPDSEFHDSEQIRDKDHDIHAQSDLFNELRKVFFSQKLYLDPEINLKTVIRLLGTNRKYLYQAISENSDQNFRSFINRYRVEEAKRLMEEGLRSGKEVNLYEMYTASGFNSAPSFYRAFKSITGLTPREYLLEIKNDIRNT